MNKMRISASICAVAFAALALTMQSCLDDDDDKDIVLRRPTALVTVRPMSDGSFIMQLDNTTELRPSNIKTSPYGDKEVRALVNYIEEKSDLYGGTKTVHVNWIDSIRTKLPVPDMADLNDETYGDDPVEIVKDWVTIAEDGYLTLRIRTLWGGADKKHFINLLTGVNPDDPYELELRHDADGDVHGIMGDALIAFNLNGLPRTDGREVKIKLRWKSFSGDKSTEFDLYLRPDDNDDDLDAGLCGRQID